jgi:hypothetical protein
MECKTKVIPVITGATGTISKSLRQHLSNMPGKHEIKKLQKTAILGTAHCGKCLCKSTEHLTWKVTLHVMNCKYRTVATLCILETWFISGI